MKDNNLIFFIVMFFTVLMTNLVMKYFKINENDFIDIVVVSLVSVGITRLITNFITHS